MLNDRIFHKERQFFCLDLTKGQAIQVVAHGRALNSPIDPELSLTDAAGKTTGGLNGTRNGTA